MVVLATFGVLIVVLGDADWRTFIPFSATNLPTLFVLLQTGSTMADTSNIVLALLVQPITSALLVVVVTMLTVEYYLGYLPQTATLKFSPRVLLSTLVLLPTTLLTVQLSDAIPSFAYLARSWIDPTIAPFQVVMRMTTFLPGILVIGALAAGTLGVILTPQVILLESLGLRAGLVRSWQLVRPRLLHVTSTIVLVCVVVALVLSLPLLVLALPWVSDQALLHEILVPMMDVVQAGLTILLGPLPSIVLTLLYFDLRVRNEGLDLEVAVEHRALNNGIVYYDRGQACLEASDIAGAVAAFTAALNELPDNIQVLCATVDALCRQGQFASALAHADHAIHHHPKISLVWNNRGYIRFQLGDDAGAFADLTRAVELSPTFKLARTNRAQVLHRQGRYDEARADLLVITLAYLKDAKARYNVASGYARQHNIEQSLEWLAQAVSLDNQLRTSALSDLDFEALRTNPRFLQLVNHDEPIGT